MEGFIYKLKTSKRQHYYFIQSSKTRKNLEDAKAITINLLINEGLLESVNDEYLLKSSIELVKNKMELVKVIPYDAGRLSIQNKYSGMILNANEISIIK